MATYKILLAEDVDKFIENLPQNEKIKINKRIEKLEIDPEHFGESRGNFWLLKVGRSGYRLAYSFSKTDKIVKIFAIEKRGSSRYEREFY